MPALLPFLFLSAASAFLSWDGGQAWVGGRIPVHEPAEPGTAARIAGGGMAGSHAVSDALRKVNQNQLTVSKMQSVANTLKPRGLKLEAETDEGKNESKGKKPIVHKAKRSGFGISQEKSLELAGFCLVWLFALDIKYC